jgi:hypothetical protein
LLVLIIYHIQILIFKYKLFIFIGLYLKIVFVYQNEDLSIYCKAKALTTYTVNIFHEKEIDGHTFLHVLQSHKWEGGLLGWPA